ncbi:store-operated calcium entry-associated regulatory factor-like isoform X1 [Pomacea canaliculata]|uniref:store-operated calcium entry-associated regulatory factor-like isoform X1 n=2 Tax=Pomacea canaliculata TaxID=400727 RepID=UPI000D72B566|nr:store-operated calcium entry-associated regulatory factor-like isoform X1 [Pomacea canaliculata]
MRHDHVATKSRAAEEKKRDGRVRLGSNYTLPIPKSHFPIGAVQMPKALARWVRIDTQDRLILGVTKMASLQITRVLNVVILILPWIYVTNGAFGSNGDRILLKDVSLLKLYSNKMTTGRRSPPVPQLKCVGGTAYGYFAPDAVQCYNRGSDGSDIQWECRATMDGDYKFGKLDVLCEGYDYPFDPYVLKGSCGLEYEIDFTKEGEMHRKQSQSSHRDDGYSKQHNTQFGAQSGSVFGHLLFVGGVAVVIYIVYKTCLSSNTTETRSDDSHRSSGFREALSHHHMASGRNTCLGKSPAQTSNGFTNAGGNASTGGGFWTGAATGGLLGYLFGRNNGYNTHYYQQPYGFPGILRGLGPSLVEIVHACRVGLTMAGVPAVVARARKQALKAQRDVERFTREWDTRVTGFKEWDDAFKTL